MLYNNFLFYVFIHQFGSMEQLTWTDRKDISGPPIVMRSIVHPVDGGLVCSELSWRTPPPVDIGLNALVVYTPKSPTPRGPITSQRRIICLFLKDFQLKGIYLGVQWYLTRLTHGATTDAGLNLGRVGIFYLGTFSLKFCEKIWLCCWGVIKDQSQRLR